MSYVARGPSRSCPALSLSTEVPIISLNIEIEVHTDSFLILVLLQAHEANVCVMAG